MLPNWLHSEPIGQQFGCIKLRVVKMFNYLQNKEKSFKWSSFFLKLCIGNVTLISIDVCAKMNS
jgi:hypothetical protein